ncbi:MAG: DUF2726 domain-containing protein [Planctomycetota bacterium]
MRIPKWAEGVLQSAGLVDAPLSQAPEISDELIARPRKCVIEAEFRGCWSRIIAATPDDCIILYRQRLTELLEFENAMEHFESVVQLDRRNVDFVICDSKGRIRLGVFLIDSRVNDQKFSWQQDFAIDVLARAGITAIRVEVSSQTLEEEIQKAMAAPQPKPQNSESVSEPSMTSAG